jgi:hypothetical protein
MDGLLVVWGAAGQNMRNIEAVERAGFPVTIECDWTAPDSYEREHLDHRYWVAEADFLKIVS